MANDENLMRDHARITTIDELKTAQKRASINATQDRLFLQNAVSDLRAQGPQVLLRNVVLPAAAVGVAVYGVTKLVGALTSGSGDYDDRRPYYREPDYDYDYDASAPGAYPPRVTNAQPVYVAPTPKPTSSIRKFATYLPVAIKLSKMAVSYLEKNGTRVPPLVHDLLAGPGISARQPVPPSQ